jgi:2,5-diketo-D-gluconate reductase A
MSARIELNDGTSIPQVGFGTLNVPPGREPSVQNTAKTAEIVAQAIGVGYRLIDTAQMYGNERGVGLGIADSGVERDQLYVTSKLGNGNHRPDEVGRSFDETLDKLGLDRLDLFLIHWAAADPLRRRLRLDLEGDDRPGRRWPTRYRRSLELPAGPPRTYRG